MENKESNTEKIRFYKKHPVLTAWLVSVIAALPVSYSMLMIAGSLSGRELVAMMVSILLWNFVIGSVAVFPIALAICELISLISVKRQRPIQGTWLVDLYVFGLGPFCEILYLGLLGNMTNYDWEVQLSNAEKHTPIYTGAAATVVTLWMLGLIGYAILQYIPLRKLPPLVTVLSISAMYLGVIELLLFTAQIYRLDDFLDLYLLILPTCCILIVARLLLAKVQEWNHMVQNAEKEHFGTGKICQNSVLRWCNGILRKAAWWPLLGLVLMFPLLGILIAILMLFGQAPDSVIKAFTETSDWNLSLRQAPQNVMYDEHYLCTVAAGGHKTIVKPIRLGRRHGHEVIVNRQLCIANAFEQVLEERTPGFHRALRHFYDTYGFPVARLIHSKYTADLVYFIMKPLEWIFLCVLYLTDAHPENRIAVQYTGKTAAQVDELYK